MSARTRAYLYLTIVAAIWGAAAIVIKYTLTYLPPFTFLSYRFIISLIVIAPFLYSHLKTHRYTFSQLREIATLNFVGIPLTLALVFIGINLTTALEASLILATGPVLTVLGGVWFLKEKIHRYEAIGQSLALLGALAVVLEPLFSGHSLAFQSLQGNLILILSNIANSYFVLRSRVDLHHKYSPWSITMIGFFIAPFLLLPFSFFEQPITEFLPTIAQAPLSAHLGVWYMALLSGILAYFLYQVGLKTINASESSIFHYLGIVFGIPLAVFWLGEPLTTPIIIGALIITAGVIISEYHPHRRRHRYLIHWFQRILNPRERLLLTFLLTSLITLTSTHLLNSQTAFYLNGYYNPMFITILIILNLLFLGFLIHRKLRRLPVMPPHYLSGYLLGLFSLIINVFSLL